MIQFREKSKTSPIYARVAPFVIFLILTSAPDVLGDATRFWFYIAKTLVGAWLLWEMRAFVSEMRWAISLEAVAVGIAVFFMWVFLDPFYPQAKVTGPAWNPFAEFGGNSTTAWAFIAVRIFGMTIVVPPLEEVFYRSFLYRYFVRINFLEMPLSRFHPTSFLVTAIVFGIAHHQWLAGILCGLAYQWLVTRKGRLGEAMTAHAITNFLLGVWVVWKGDWKFF